MPAGTWGTPVVEGKALCNVGHAVVAQVAPCKVDGPIAQLLPHQVQSLGGILLQRQLTLLPLRFAPVMDVSCTGGFRVPVSVDMGDQLQRGLAPSLLCYNRLDWNWVPTWASAATTEGSEQVQA